MDERESIARLKRGDIAGLQALVERYQLQAVRAAYLVTGDRAEAEDVVQAAFLRAYQRIDQFDAARPFGPWFLRSVVNAALRAATRQGRQVDLEGEEATLDELLAGQAPDPGELLIAAETGQAVREALDRLPPLQRAAVVMRYYLGLSEAEMARRMDCPPGTIKWRLHAARQRLRELL